MSLLVFLRIDDDPIIPERDGNQHVMVNEKKISNEYTDHATLNFVTRSLRRRSKIKKRYSDFIMNTPPSSFDDDADLECALLISQNVQEKKNIHSPVCEDNETSNESEANDKIKEANISNEKKAMRLLKCIDNINNKKSTKGENLKHGKVEKKGKIADNLNNTEVEDEYTKLLQHSSLCKIKTTQLIAYRTHDRNTVRVKDKRYLAKLQKYIKENGNIPTEDPIVLAIDREDGTAVLWEGN